MGIQKTKGEAEVKFEIWEQGDVKFRKSDGACLYEDRCIAVRNEEEVKRDFYDMWIGEQRSLNNPSYYIMRIQ